MAFNRYSLKINNYLRGLRLFPFGTNYILVGILSSTTTVVPMVTFGSLNIL